MKKVPARPIEWLKLGNRETTKNPWKNDLIILILFFLLLRYIPEQVQNLRLEHTNKTLGLEGRARFRTPKELG